MKTRSEQKPIEVSCGHAEADILLRLMADLLPPGRPFLSACSHRGLRTLWALIANTITQPHTFTYTIPFGRIGRQPVHKFPWGLGESTAAAHPNDQLQGALIGSLHQHHPLSLQDSVAIPSQPAMAARCLPAFTQDFPVWPASLNGNFLYICPWRLGVAAAARQVNVSGQQVPARVHDGRDRLWQAFAALNF